MKCKATVIIIILICTYVHNLNVNLMTFIVITTYILNGKNYDLKQRSANLRPTRFEKLKP